MPEIYRAGHAIMLSEKIKKSNVNKSNINSFRENDKKNIFILAKNKMGYLMPFNAKFSLSEDTDFSNSLILKTYLEAKDSKSIYAYYILTKSDFSICGISSSAIHLGLSMDILNKYFINMEFLIKDKNLKDINFAEKINEEELQEAIWIYPNLIYPKEKINIDIKQEDIPELIKASHKKKSINGNKYYKI